MLTNVLNFTIDGIQGDLRLEYGAFSQKLFQNGNEIKNAGKKMKYIVTNTDGNPEELTLLKGLDFVYQASFRGIKTPLEEKLTVLQYILGIIPILLVFTGGAIGGAIGGMGAVLVLNYVRLEKSLVKQILIAIGISALCAVVYFLIAGLLYLLF